MASNLKQENPYVGPRPFEQTESKYFFGRDEETKILSGLVIAHQLSLFYAQSGAGKSSLLRAGLLPRLTRKTRVGSGENAYLYQTMHVLPIVTVGRGVPPSTTETILNIFSFSAQLSLLPSADPNDLALLRLEETVEILLDDGIAAGAVWEPAQERNGRVRPSLIKPDTTLLIFDQFEEIFTVHPERWREREEFFRQVDATLTHFPTLHILFTMREDYLAELTPYANLLTDDLRHRFRMERLRKAGALAAVVQPALAGEPSRTYAPGVAEALVDNLRRIQRSQRSQLLARVKQTGADGATEHADDQGEYVEPVHLQIVCRDLWAGLSAERTAIQESDLQSFGDVDQALTNFYESTLAKVVAETSVSERALRRWFNEELITPARTKGLVYRDDQVGETVGLPNAAVDILRDAWLIRGDIRGGDVWYELAHDRLVEPILAANLAWQEQYYNPVAAAYQRWVDGRNPDDLLRDRALYEAEAYADQYPSEITDEERQYLIESRRQWDDEQEGLRQAATRRRNLLGIGALVMIVLTSLTIFALRQADKATRAAQAAETAESRANKERATAVAQATRADQEAEKARVAQASAEAEAAIARSRRLATQSTVAFNDYSHSGQRDTRILALNLAIQAGQAFGTIEAFTTLISASYFITFQGHTDTIWHAIWNRDESKVLTSSEDKTARIWDAKSGKQLLILQGHQLGVKSAKWNQDGSKILTHTGEYGNVASESIGSVKIWDGESGRELLTIYQRGNILSAGWNYDESKIFVSSTNNLTSTATVWDATTREPIATLHGHSDRIFLADWSQFGPNVLTRTFNSANNFSDHTARVWDSQTGQQLLKLSHDGPITLAKWNQDESKILTASFDGTARVWNARTGEEILVLPHSRDVMSAKWNEDESKILTVSGDVYVWNAESSSKEITFLPQRSSAIDAKWSQDESQILTISGDGTVQLWDVASRRIVANAKDEYFRSDFYNNTFNLEWSQDESKIRATIGILTLNIQERIAVACVSLERNLTWDEWQRFMNDLYRPTCVETPIPPNAIDAITDEAKTLTQNDDLPAAAERLGQLVSWLRENGQFNTFGVEQAEWLAALEAGENPWAEE